MLFAVFLPLAALIIPTMLNAFHKKNFAWETGVVALLVSFAKMANMAFKNLTSGRVANIRVGPLMSADGTDYAWRISLDTTEIFFSTFVLFCALAVLFFSKKYLADDKMLRFVRFLSAMVFCVLIATGADNVFQFMAGWDGAVVFACLSLLLFYEKQITRTASTSFPVWHFLTDVFLLSAFWMMAQKTGNFLLPSFENQPSVLSAGEAFSLAVLLILGVSSKLFLFGTNILIFETSAMFLPALAFVVPVAFAGLGVYLLYLFFPSVGAFPPVRMLFLIWGALTALGGLVSALAQTNIKALLCHLLMSLFGFVLTVFGLAGREVAFCSYVALMGPMIGLLLTSGTVVYALHGQEDMARMGGLKNETPFSFWLAVVFSLCCIGFPYVGNFGVFQDLYAALYLQGGPEWVIGFAVFCFLLSTAFARFLYYLFFAPLKVSVEILGKKRTPAASMKIALVSLASMCLFQNKVFQTSVLPNLTEPQSVEIFVLSLFGCAGLLFGVVFFQREDLAPWRQNAKVRALFDFFAKDFYLSALYRFLFVRPIVFISRLLWYHSGMELFSDKIPSAVRKTAERLQKTHSGTLSYALFWTFGGLFALIYSLMFLKGGG